MRLTHDTPTIGAARQFQSDREVLPFPAGGVFGPTEDTTTASNDDLTASIESTIEQMQQSLDELDNALGEELDRELQDVLGSINTERSQSDWPPAAA
ncbi:MAG: hypothetical protein AAFX05_08685 [Planctomycetota bacterium]